MFKRGKLKPQKQRRTRLDIKKRHYETTPCQICKRNVLGKNVSVLRKIKFRAKT